MSFNRKQSWHSPKIKLSFCFCFDPAVLVLLLVLMGLGAAHATYIVTKLQSCYKVTLVVIYTYYQGGHEHKNSWGLGFS